MADKPEKHKGIPTLGDVREHAQNLVADLAKKSGVSTVDELAGAVPDFSKGTSPLDDDGNPVVAHAATLSPDALPEPGQTLSDAAAEAARMGGHPEPERDRGLDGRFKKAGEEGEPQAQPQAKPAVAAESQAAAEPQAAQDLAAPSAEAGTAAAEAAAANILNRDDYDEIEYEDGDEKYTVLAPKAVAPKVKNGYARRAVMDRATRYLGQARQALEPLVASGQISNLVPVIQRAVNDPEFAQFVAEAYNRRITGLPLTPQQQQVVQQIQAAQAQQVPQEPQIPTLTAEEDPWLAQQLGPYEQRLKQFEQKFQTYEQQQQTERDRQQQAIAANQRAAQTVADAHGELSRYYPDEWSGDPNRDDAMIRRTIQYAHESGLVQSYGATVPTLVVAYERMRADRIAAAASPAAAAVTQATAERQMTTRNAAAAAAVVPSGTPQSAPQKVAAKPLPPTRDPKTGQATPIKEFAAQAFANVLASQR